MKPEVVSVLNSVGPRHAKKNKNKNTSFQLRYFSWQHKLKTKKLRQQSALSWSRALAPPVLSPPEHTWGRPGEAGVGCAQRCPCCPQEKSRQLSAEQRARPINTGFGAAELLFTPKGLVWMKGRRGARLHRLTGPALLLGASPLSVMPSLFMEHE